MSALLAANCVCGPGFGLSWIACFGIPAGALLAFFGGVPAIVREHYDICRRRIARLAVLVDIPDPFDIAALSALGLQVKNDRRHIAIVDALEQLALGQVEVLFDDFVDDFFE